MSAEKWAIERADLGPGVAAMIYQDTGGMPVIVLPPKEGGKTVGRLKALRGKN